MRVAALVFDCGSGLFWADFDGFDASYAVFPFVAHMLKMLGILVWTRRTVCIDTVISSLWTVACARLFLLVTMHFVLCSDRPMVRTVSICSEACGVSTCAVFRHARCDAGQVFGLDSEENRRVPARCSGGGWTCLPLCNDRLLSSGVQTCRCISWTWLLTCPLVRRQVCSSSTRSWRRGR